MITDDCGVFYIAYGRAAWGETLASIDSLRKHHPNLPVYVIGEQFPIREDITIIYSRDSNTRGRREKVTLYNISPFRYTLYLDADTRIMQRIDTLFEILKNGWDMVIAPSANQGEAFGWHIPADERDHTIEQIGFTPLQLQAGVFGFARNRVLNVFFRTWAKEWGKYKGQDQAAFLRAFYGLSSPPKVWVLGRAWNGGAIIHHLHGRAVEHG